MNWALRRNAPCPLPAHVYAEPMGVRVRIEYTDGGVALHGEYDRDLTRSSRLVTTYVAGEHDEP